MFPTLRSFIIISSFFLPWTALPSSADIQKSNSPCCNAFLSTFPGQVDLPGSPGFAVQLSEYFSAQESEIISSCRVKPNSAPQVAEILNITTQLGCQFAVRSGGHMPWAGSANIDGPGVTIDLGLLNSTTISEDKTVAHVQPGARWGSVYDTLDPEGLVAVGGRGEGIGVGGYLLGGGLSFFSPKFGFASDNVVGYQIVTANGQILEVSSRQNPDLFWALRVGSTNFGIVVRYDLRTLPSTRMFGGIRSYNITHALDAAKALVDFTNKVAAEGLDTCGLDLGPGDTFFMNFAHITPNINGSNVFNSTLSIPPLTDTTRSNVTLTNLLQEIDALFSSGLHVSFRTLSFIPNAQFMVDMWQEGRKIFAPFDGNANVSWTLGFQPIPLSMIRAIESADDPQGLTTEDGAIMITNLSAFWTDSISEDEMQRKLAALIEWGKVTAQKRGIWKKYLYLNYASRDMDPYTSLPSANTQRLRAIRRKMDPEGIFQKKWPGGFKL